jgi:hypothetical protein
LNVHSAMLCEVVPGGEPALAAGAAEGMPLTAEEVRLTVGDPAVFDKAAFRAFFAFIRL